MLNSVVLSCSTTDLCCFLGEDRLKVHNLLLCLAGVEMEVVVLVPRRRGSNLRLAGDQATR